MSIYIAHTPPGQPSSGPIVIDTQYADEKIITDCRDRGFTVEGPFEKLTKFTLIMDYDGDWAAIYKDGENVFEGHASSAEHELLRLHPEIDVIDGTNKLKPWDAPDADPRLRDFPQKLEDWPK